MRQAGLGIAAFYTPTGVGTYVEYGKVPIRFKPGSPIPDMISEPKEVNKSKYTFFEKIF